MRDAKIYQIYEVRIVACCPASVLVISIPASAARFLCAVSNASVRDKLDWRGRPLSGYAPIPHLTCVAVHWQWFGASLCCFVFVRLQGTSQIQRLIVSRDILTDPSLVTP